MDDFSAPKNNLVRARFGQGVELRAADASSGPTLIGHFSQFNSWYPISSMWEGDFMERVAPGAFTDTIKNDIESMRVLYDHGRDPQLGNKPLGPIATLEEDSDGPYYEVPLLDTDYNREFVIPALEGRLISGEKTGSQLGASFRFEVINEEWAQKPKASKMNPTGLPERTITQAKVFEFGPVTFPASAGASAGMRSLSDEFIQSLRTDPAFVARLTDRTSLPVVEQFLSSLAPTGSNGGAAQNASEASTGHSTRTHSQRRALLLELEKDSQ